MSEGILTRVAQIIREVSRTAPDELTPDHHLLVDLGIDSPLAIELLIRLQTEVGLKVTEDEAGQVETVGDLYALAERKLVGV